METQSSNRSASTFNRYLCFFSILKSNEKKLSSNNMNKLKKSTITNSDSSSDSTDSPKARSNSIGSNSLSQNDEIVGAESSKNNDRSASSSKKSTANHRTFSTLGSSKQVRVEDEVIYPSYTRSTPRSVKLSGEYVSSASLKEIAEREELNNHSRQSRSTSRSASKPRSSSRSSSRSSTESRNSARRPSSARLDNETPRSRSCSRNRPGSANFNQNGFSDNGMLSSTGLPFDNSNYKVADTKVYEIPSRLSRSHLDCLRPTSSSNSLNQLEQLVVSSE